jgi:class 3 adenylate cyclase
MQTSFGSGAALQTLANNFFPFITLGAAGPAAPNLERVQAIYNQEARDAIAALFADRPTGDKIAEAQRKELMETVPQTGRIFESAEKSLANHQSFVRKLRSKKSLIEQALAEPSTRGSGEALKKRQDQLAAINKALSFWEPATAMLQNSIEGTGNVDARLKTMGIEPTGVNRTQQMVQDVFGVQ